MYVGIIIVYKRFKYKISVCIIDMYDCITTVSYMQETSQIKDITPFMLEVKSKQYSKN
jgi:hypothetical protein